MKPTTRRTLIIVGVILLVIIAFVIAYELTRPTEINYQGTDDSFVGMLERGEIQSIYIEGNYTAKIQKRGDKGYGYFVNTQGRVAFSDIIKDYSEAGKLDGVVVRYDDPSSGSLVSSILVPLILYAALFGIFMVVLRKSAGAQGQALNFGKTKANQVRDIKVRFNDVAGAEEEKQELQEIVDFLKHPKKYTDIGARIPRRRSSRRPSRNGQNALCKSGCGRGERAFLLNQRFGLR